VTPPKRRFTQYLHGATSQKTAFFIATAVKPSNLTKLNRSAVEAYKVFFHIMQLTIYAKIKIPQPLSQATISNYSNVFISMSPFSEGRKDKHVNLHATSLTSLSLAP
jgi:hypothetical protein